MWFKKKDRRKNKACDHKHKKEEEAKKLKIGKGELFLNVPDEEYMIAKMIKKHKEDEDFGKWGITFSHN
jgi:hypothetical protein